MSQTAKKYSLLDVINLMTDFLQEKGIENGRLNAELIAGKVFDLNRVQLYLNFERPVTSQELGKLRELLKRRANHEPLQYVLGKTEFYSLPIEVTPATLIPRPETEILVDFVLNNYKKFFPQSQKLNILDLGTGSGNIAIALAKHIENAKIIAIDISAEALKIARNNAVGNGVDDKIDFLQLDIFSNVPENFMQQDIVVANLPYISATEMETLPIEVKQYEPHEALFGGKDGLDYFRKLSKILNLILSKPGLVALEIGADQADKVKNIFLQHPNMTDYDVISDLNGLARVFWAKFE